MCSCAPLQVALQDIEQAQAEQQVLQVQATASVAVARSLATIQSAFAWRAAVFRVLRDWHSLAAR